MVGCVPDLVRTCAPCGWNISPTRHLRSIGVLTGKLASTCAASTQILHHSETLLLSKARCPWTSLVCVSSPKYVYLCVWRCPSQTPNTFLCVSPNAFICVSPNASAESATELASLTYLCSNSCLKSVLVQTLILVLLLILV